MSVAIKCHKVRIDSSLYMIVLKGMLVQCCIDLKLLSQWFDKLSVSFVLPHRMVVLNT